MMTAEKPYKRAWLTVGLLFVVAALNYLDRTMITTMRTSIVADFSISDAQFGLLTSVFLWSYGILSPLGGYLADRFRREWVIIGSLFVWSVVTWLTGYAQNFEQLLATRVLMGVSEAFYMPAALALIVDYHPGRTQSRAVGIHLAGTTTGQALGFLGIVVTELAGGWEYAFRYFGIIGVIYAVFVDFFLKRPDELVEAEQKSTAPKSEVSFLDAMKQLFSQPSFILLLLFWCVLGIVGWLVLTWLPTYYKEAFALSDTEAGFYATTPIYLASAAGLLVGGFLSDRWLKTNRYARILVPIVGLAVAAPGIFIAGYVHVLVLATIFFICYAFTRMFVDANLMPALCMIVDERYRATGYGVLNMLGVVVAGVGVYAAGWLRDNNIGLGTIYQSAALCLVVCILLMAGVYRNVKKQDLK